MIFLRFSFADVDIFNKCPDFHPHNNFDVEEVNVVDIIFRFDILHLLFSWSFLVIELRHQSSIQNHGANSFSILTVHSNFFTTLDYAIFSQAFRWMVHSTAGDTLWWTKLVETTRMYLALSQRNQRGKVECKIAENDFNPFLNFRAATSDVNHNTKLLR